MVLLEVQHCDYRAVWLFTYHSDHVASGWQSIYNDAAHHCLSFFMGYNPLSAHTSQRVPQQIGRGCAPEPEFCAITTVASHTSKRLHHHGDSCFAGHDNSHMQHSVVITIQSSSWRSETQHSATKSDTQKPGSKKLPQFSPGRKPHTIITAMTFDQISKHSQQQFDSCHTGTAIFNKALSSTPTTATSRFHQVTKHTIRCTPSQATSNSYLEAVVTTTRSLISKDDCPSLQLLECD